MGGRLGDLPSCVYGEAAATLLYSGPWQSRQRGRRSGGGRGIALIVSRALSWRRSEGGLWQRRSRHRPLLATRSAASPP